MQTLYAGGMLGYGQCRRRHEDYLSKWSSYHLPLSFLPQDSSDLLSGSRDINRNDAMGLPIPGSLPRNPVAPLSRGTEKAPEWSAKETARAKPPLR
jgi:hypothetical protein